MNTGFLTIKDQSLTLEVEQFLAKQEAQKIQDDVDQLPSGYIELPAGFTKFKDGNIPMSKRQSYKTEAESLADIEKQNQRTLEARKIMYAEQVKQIAEARKKAKAEQFAEQKRIMAQFRDRAKYGDLKRLADECGVKPDVLAKLSQSVMKFANWQKIKLIIENFKYSEFKPTGFTQRARKNREKMDEAIAANQKDFIGTCAKHGEVTHQFCWRDDRQKYRFWCAVCRRERYKNYKTVPRDQSGSRFKNEETKREYFRRLEVKEAKQRAVSQGLTTFEAPCKKHGLTMFRILINAPVCILCRKIVDKNRSESKKLKSKCK
jgi:hypothetical protein